VEADYQDPLLEDYRGNPLLEALPPIWDDKSVVKSWPQNRSFKLPNVSCLSIYDCIAFSIFLATFSNHYRGIWNYNRVSRGCLEMVMSDVIHLLQTMLSERVETLMSSSCKAIQAVIR